MTDEAVRAALAEYGARAFWALVVIVVSLLIARGLRRATMRALQRGHAHRNAIVLLGNLAQTLVLFVGALVVLAIFTGPNFVGILASFSVLGLVIGFSLQDILKNFFAGIWLLVERPFRIGDTIQVEAHTGVVEEISFRTTLLRTLDGRQVIVPNSTLMTTPVTNHSAYPLQRQQVRLALMANELPDDAAGTIGAALGEVGTVAKEPAPRVDLRGVTSGRARFVVTFWAPEAAQAVPDAIAALRARFPNAEVRDV